MDSEIIFKKFNDNQFKGNLIEKIDSKIGSYKLCNGVIYTGESFNGLCHGSGEVLYTTGERYAGSFSKGFLIRGSMILQDGTKYVGTFKHGKMNGFCNVYYSNGTSFYGDFTNGKRYGSGTFSDINGNKRSGQWRHEYLVKEENSLDKYLSSQKQNQPETKGIRQKRKIR